MARQGDPLAAAIASVFRIGAEDSARLAEGVAVETVRARAEIAQGALVVRGASKVVVGELVLDVARAPSFALPGPWKHVALRQCLVAHIDAEKLAEHSGALVRLHASAAHALAERIEARAAPTVEARLERLLSDLAKRYGTRVSDGVFLALPLRGRDAASLVGTTTETVSRVLAAWKRAGRIRSTRDGVWIRHE